MTRCVCIRPCIMRIKGPGALLINVVYPERMLTTAARQTLAAGRATASRLSRTAALATSSRLESLRTKLASEDEASKVQQILEFAAQSVEDPVVVSSSEEKLPPARRVKKREPKVGANVRVSVACD